jgi:hypothetical protein
MGDVIPNEGGLSVDVHALISHHDAMQRAP